MVNIPGTYHDGIGRDGEAMYHLPLLSIIQAGGLTPLELKTLFGDKIT